MRFTIERKRLVKMLESVRRKLPGQKKKDKEVRLYACAARVFVEANGGGVTVVFGVDDQAVSRTARARV
jgi:hypothetical protein